MIVLQSFFLDFFGHLSRKVLLFVYLFVTVGEDYHGHAHGHHYHHHPHHVLSHVEPIPYQPLDKHSIPLHESLPPVNHNHLHVSASSPKYFHGPKYYSMYDIDIPKVMYANSVDELDIQGSQANDALLDANSIAAVKPVEPIHSKVVDEDDPRIIEDTLSALYSSPFLSKYLATLDSLTPVYSSPYGFEERLGLVYKDRKKKKK